MNSVLPASVPLSLWEEFRKMRVRIRHPMTPYAETLILVKLEKWRIEQGANPVDVLNESIERGWSGIFLNGHASKGKLPSMGVQHLACAACGRSLEAGFKYSRLGKLCHDC